MPTETKKEFDSVQMMRELRDQISRDIEGMTFEQEKAYIRERLQQAREVPVAANSDHPA